MAAGTAGSTKPKYQATTAPATTIQNGQATKPCRAYSTHPCQPAGSWAMTVCSGATNIEPSKNPPNRIGLVNQIPANTEGMANKANGKTMVQGDSLGSPWTRWSSPSSASWTTSAGGLRKFSLP